MVDKKLVVEKEDKYCLYELHGIVGKRKVSFTASLPAFHQYREEEIAAAWLGMESEGSLVCGVASGGLANKIRKYYREHPEHHFEMLQRPDLARLYWEARPVIDAMVVGIAVMRVEQKKKFGGAARNVFGPDYSVGECWRLFVLWLLRNFYAGTDQEVMAVYRQQMGYKKDFDVLNKGWLLLDLLSLQERLDTKKLLEIVLQHGTKR